MRKGFVYDKVIKYINKRILIKTSQMSTSKVITSHKHIESKDTDDTSHKNTNKKDISYNKGESKKSQTDPRGSTSRTDNLDSIILNLSQLEGNEKKEKDTNAYSNI